MDDDSINIEAVTYALDAEYDIFSALNGYGAIDLLKEQKPDLILLDVMMPDLSGFDVCTIIKSDEDFADIPVIFLTALDSQDAELRGLELGGVDYITKPINFTLLKQRVRNHIQSKERNDLVKEQRDLLARQKEVLAQMLAEQLETAETLRVSEERHRSILQTAMDGIWLADTQGRLLEVNEAYCTMSGYSTQELLLMNISDIEAIETADDTARRIHRIREQGEDRFESRHRRKDGTVYDVEVSVQFRPVEGGQCVAFLRDITERKQAETYREMSNEILQLLNNPGELQDSIRNVIAVLKARTGFDAVGIRLQDGDDFPYSAQTGFSEEFLLKENSLIGRARDGGV